MITARGAVFIAVLAGAAVATSSCANRASTAMGDVVPATPGDGGSAGAAAPNCPAVAESGPDPSPAARGDATPSADSGCAGTCSCTGNGCLVTLAAGRDYPSSLAIDGAHVYWTDERAATVMKVAISGGSPTTFATGAQGESMEVGNITSVGPLVLSGSQLYWVAATDAEVGLFGPGEVRGYAWLMHEPVSGGVPTVAAGMGEGYPFVVGGLAASGEAMFWTLSARSSVEYEVAETNLSGQGRFASSDSPLGVAADETSVYWTSSRSSGSVMKADFTVTPADEEPGGPEPVVAGKTITLASDQDTPAGIAVDATSVYWTTLTGGTVMKVAKTGGTTVTLASGQRAPYGIAVNASGVYWTNQSSGAVMTVPPSGGAATTLAAGQATPHAIAVDATNVYWTDYSECGAVMKLTVACACP